MGRGQDGGGRKNCSSIEKTVHNKADASYRLLGSNYLWDMIYTYLITLIKQFAVLVLRVSQAKRWPFLFFFSSRSNHQSSVPLLQPPTESHPIHARHTHMRPHPPTHIHKPVIIALLLFLALPAINNTAGLICARPELPAQGPVPVPVPVPAGPNLH